MTFKNAFLVLLASFAFTSAAFAVEPGYINYDFGYDVTGKPHPAPLPDPDEEQSGREEVLTIHVQKRLMNVAADLRYLAGIDYRYSDYILESVVVDVRGSSMGTSMDLVIDNRIEQTTMNPYGQMVFFPRNNMAIDRDIHQLLIGVRGVADVDRIQVNLRRLASRPNPPTPDRVTVPVYVNRRVVGSGFIDLRQFPEARRYDGYRIFSMEVDAQSIYQTAYLDLMINGRMEGGSQVLNPYPRPVTFYPMNARLGQDQIMLRCNGDQQIRQIILRLQR